MTYNRKAEAIHAYKNGEFNKAFSLLERIRHPDAEALKGRIRSLELKFDEAEEHFDKAEEKYKKAEEKYEEAEESIPNLIGECKLQICRFDNELLTGPLETGYKISYPDMPPLPEEIMDEYPEVKDVITLRYITEAKLRLHLGEDGKAKILFGKVINELGRKAPDYLSLGLIAAEFNKNKEPRELEYNLEILVDSLSHQIEKNLVRFLQNVANIYAFYLFENKHQEAKEGLDIINAVDCPKKTKDIFIKHAELYARRCEEAGRLLIW